jgi:hypothetical protein
MADALRSVLLEQIDPHSPGRREHNGFDCHRLIWQPGWVKRAVTIASETARHWDAYREWPALRTIDSREFIELNPRE